MRANLGQQVFQHLRDRIYSMEIEPGTHLGVGEVADLLNVSRSPVRDAFLMLLSEGVVESVPGGGYRVIKFDRGYINEVFEYRRALELAAVRLSVRNLDKPRILALKDTWEQFKTAEESDPEFLELHLRADNDLHQSIAEMSQNRLLKEALAKIISVAALIRRWQYSGGVPYRNLILTIQEHLKILDAILARDENGAVAALDEHLTLAHARSLARLEVNAAHADPQIRAPKKKKRIP